MAAARGACGRIRRRRRRGDLSATSSRRRRPAASARGTTCSCSARSRTRSPTASAPRARRSRSRPPARPARPRSSSASRRSGAARPRPRCASAPTARCNPESLIRFSLLSALSTQNDPPEGAAKPFSKNRDGFVMGEGAAALVLEDYEHARARGARILGYRARLRREAATASTAPARARTASRSSLPSATPSTMPACRPTTIDYINAHGTGTPENDKMECDGLHGGVRRAHEARADLVQQVDDRPHADGGGRGRGGDLAPDASRIGRIPPTINYAVPDPAIPLDVVPNVARDAHGARACCRTPSASAARTPASCWRRSRR